MNVTQLWWSDTLLRIEGIAGSTIHLLDNRSLNRVADAAGRLSTLCQDVKVSRATANH